MFSHNILFKYYRLPSPDLWSDVFQKFKALGYNTASLYFFWGYHSASQGVYDFEGVRDVQKVLDDAKSAGIHVIARPGPYVRRTRIHALLAVDKC